MPALYSDWLEFAMTFTPMTFAPRARAQVVRTALWEGLDRVFTTNDIPYKFYGRWEW